MEKKAPRRFGFCVHAARWEVESLLLGAPRIRQDWTKDLDFFRELQNGARPYSEGEAVCKAGSQWVHAQFVVYNLGSRT